MSKVKFKAGDYVLLYNERIDKITCISQDENGTWCKLLIHNAMLWEECTLTPISIETEFELIMYGLQ